MSACLAEPVHNAFAVSGLFCCFVPFGAAVPLCRAKQFFYCKGVAYKINATVSKFLQP